MSPRSPQASKTPDSKETRSTSRIFAGIDVPSSEWDGDVQLLVVVPNGDVVCECG